MAKHKKSGYRNEPKVPANKIANKPPIQNASLGNATMPTVPFVANPPAPNRPPIGGPPHGYGHKPHQKSGNLRLSGNGNAHRLGMGKAK